MDSSVASLILNVEQGDASAADALFTLLYAELHRLAKAQLARNAGDLTLGTTTLLHEAYLDLAGRDRAVFPDRARFMGYAARAMRGLILNHGRGRRALKRGGEFTFQTLDAALEERSTPDPDLKALGAALETLGALEPRLAQVVDLKFFCGFSFEEIAGMLETSERTVQRDWEKARIYLHGTIAGSAR